MHDIFVLGGLGQDGGLFTQARQMGKELKGYRIQWI
jgi:hypothetical protein